MPVSSTGDPKPLPDFLRLRNESGTSDDMYHYALLEHIPEEFQALPEKELNETEEKKREGLKRLREFLKREKKPDVDDYLLTMVLRNCKYDMKKSETRLRKFLKARQTVIEKAARLDLKKVELILEDKAIGLLPFRDKHGRAIVFTRPEAMNDDAYSMDEVMLTTVALAVFAFPITSVGGVAYLGDCKYKSVSSYMALLKAAYQHIQTLIALPVRIARIDLINEHFLTRWFISAIRPFVSFKILNRLTFYGSDLDKLQNEYHPDILPEEFGGRMGPLDPSFFKNMALDIIRQIQADATA